MAQKIRRLATITIARPVTLLDKSTIPAGTSGTVVHNDQRGAGFVGISFDKGNGETCGWNGTKAEANALLEPSDVAVVADVAGIVTEKRVAAGAALSSLRDALAHGADTFEELETIARAAAEYREAFAWYALALRVEKAATSSSAIVTGGR